MVADIETETLTRRGISAGPVFVGDKINLSRFSDREKFTETILITSVIKIAGRGKKSHNLLKLNFYRSRALEIDEVAI